VGAIRWWDRRAEILRWSRLYDEKQPALDLRMESEVGSRLRNTRRLSKRDLAKMVSWKFGSLPGRRSLVMSRVESIGEREIQEAFRQALDSSSERIRISELLRLPGIGPAMASVILTFYDPKEYAVLDIHVWRELFGKEPQGLFQGPKHLLRFLQTVRLIARKHDLDARTVEKALFQRNLTHHRPQET